MTDHEASEALDLIAFWTGAGPAAWFTPSDAFDGECRRYLALWDQAANGGLKEWLTTAAGTLAYILITDQLPRNMFRGEAQQYATDPLALAAAQEAIARGYPRGYAMPVKNFYFLPLMHAEDLTVQEDALTIYRALRDQEHYYYALVHHDAIRRFGRFPHRNAMLGRETTPEEAEYLATGGFGG